MVYALATSFSSHYFNLFFKELCLTMELLMKNYITHVAVNKVPPIRVAASKLDCSSFPH